MVEAEFSLPIFIKLLPAIVTFLGAGLSLYLYHVASQFTIGLASDSSSSAVGRAFYKFFNAKYILMLSIINTLFEVA